MASDISLDEALQPVPGLALPEWRFKRLPTYQATEIAVLISVDPLKIQSSRKSAISKSTTQVEGDISLEFMGLDPDRSLIDIDIE